MIKFSNIELRCDENNADKFSVEKSGKRVEFWSECETDARHVSAYVTTKDARQYAEEIVRICDEIDTEEREAEMQELARRVGLPNWL